jgi:hypothetical protein
MALNANKIPSQGGQKAAPLEPDNYMARVVQVIDLGVQPQRPYKGKEKPPAREIMLTYELGTEFMTDDEGNIDEDRPRWLSETMPLHNLKADRAKSTHRYTALDPKGQHGGDFAALVNTPCLVAVVNNEKDGRVYNNIGGVTQPLKGVPVPELKNPTKTFDTEEPDMEVFESLPDWIQDKIKENLEYQGSALQAAIEGGTTPEPAKEADEDVDEDFDV